MARPNNFQPKGVLVARRPEGIRIGGRDYAQGEAVGDSTITLRKRLQLYEHNFLCHPEEYEALIEDRDEQNAIAEVNRGIVDETETETETKETEDVNPDTENPDDAETAEVETEEVETETAERSETVDGEGESSEPEVEVEAEASPEPEAQANGTSEPETREVEESDPEPAAEAVVDTPRVRFE